MSDEIEVGWVTTRCSSESACVQVHGAWVTTRCDNGQCVQVRCDTGSCIQVRCESGSCVEASAIGQDTVAMRSTLVPDDLLRVTREEWLAFVAAIKEGQFDGV